MTMPTRFARNPLAIALALPLALAACDSGTDAEGTGTAAVSGEPIAPIAAPEGQDWTQTAVVTDMGGVQAGNPDAPLKLVEYASHTCSHCATFSQESHDAMQEYIASGVVSYEIRNQIHDPLDLTFAMLARCGDPAAFHPLSAQGWADLNQIIANAQANPEGLQQAMERQDTSRFQAIAQQTGLLDWFSARGISRDQAMSCMADQSMAEQIVERSQTQSEELEVTGTPTFFLNGNRIEGTAWSLIDAALQEAGAR